MISNQAELYPQFSSVAIDWPYTLYVSAKKRAQTVNNLAASTNTMVMRRAVWVNIFLYCKFSEQTFERKCYVTWHFPSMQMSIEPGLHGVPSITLAASFAEKRYWGSLGLQNREHGWPETGMRNNKDNNFIYHLRIAN